MICPDFSRYMSRKKRKNEKSWSSGARFGQIIVQIVFFELHKWFVANLADFQCWFFFLTGTILDLWLKSRLKFNGILPKNKIWIKIWPNRAPDDPLFSFFRFFVFSRAHIRKKRRICGLDHHETAWFWENLGKLIRFFQICVKEKTKKRKNEKSGSSGARYDQMIAHIVFFGQNLSGF